MQDDNVKLVVSNNSVENQDFLLFQLQQRFCKLGGTPLLGELPKQQLKKLIAVLYQARNRGQSAVLLEEFQQLHQLDVVMLQKDFPYLIAIVNADAELKSAPILIFPPFVAFRRDYYLLKNIVKYLKRLSNFSIPSPRVQSKINWQLGNGAKVSDEQRLAAITAATLSFSIITGGAGTGKTTTLAKALELILLENPDSKIIIAAPTGKAAHRLNESLANEMDSVAVDVREVLSKLTAKTIHRVLGISEQSGRPFYNARHPLRCDVLAIDEASMLSGDLFTLIQQALLNNTRLILLGDANQLPAVNATAFFNEISQLTVGYSADFCQLVNPLLEQKIVPSVQLIPLPNIICRLTVSRRFLEKSVMNLAADSVLQSDSKAVLAALSTQFIPLNQGEFLNQLLIAYAHEKAPLMRSLTQRMILCANRQGLFGSEVVNTFLDKHCRLILGRSSVNFQPWYRGRRIIIEKNDYHLGVNNGDIGCCQWRDNEWQIAFDEERWIRVSDLSDVQYSLGFAISIHKSQGSEYSEVDVILDQFDVDNPNPIITQSLLYTAVTRAKHSLTVYGNIELLDYALKQKIADISPLQTML
ncbi:MAG: exodeoxyribonuclease V subunit alpha [Ostreibacterium sp.]